MNGEGTQSPGRFPLPRQHNLQTAVELALRELRSRTPQQLQSLGAALAEGKWRLGVLNSDLCVDVSNGRVTVPDGPEVSDHWRILVLHYLSVAPVPPRLSPEIAFADLASGRSYANVYNKRVTDRLCATAGRDARTLKASADDLGARGVEGGDLAFDLAPFPLVTVRVVWYAADDEFPPSATLLLPGNIESFFCIEDIVVLSERVVSRLDGRKF